MEFIYSARHGTGEGSRCRRGCTSTPPNSFYRWAVALSRLLAPVILFLENDVIWLDFARFGAMKKKGWHEVRLVDASGDPLVEANAPADDFEKAAVAALLAGQTGYEPVIEKEGQRFLRSATPVPVVMKKCTLCHSNYEGVREGQPIGALSYIVPVE